MEDIIERQFDTGSHPTLEIGNSVGTMVIQGAQTSSVAVRATKHGSQEELSNTDVEFRHNGDEVVVVTRTHGRGCAVDFEVTVPRECSVTATSASGGITACNVAASVRINNSSGSITVEDIDGDCTLNTASGLVDAHRMRGALTANTASGAIDIRDSYLTHLDLGTASGNTRIETPLLPEGQYRAKTASGNVALLVPPETGATLTLQTMSGNLTSDIAAEIEKRGFGMWHGRLNGGGATVEMHSASGDLRVSPSAHVNGHENTRSTAAESETWQEPMSSSTTAVLKALERGDLTLDAAMEKLNNL
ncbi:MAG: hypothetical protein NVSMB22_01080 [Chloroflexota bacterium]